MNKEIDNEVWKDIDGFEGKYQVSDQGRIKSLGNNRERKEKILKQVRCGLKNQYWRIQLRKNGRLKNITVHRLVAQAFIPNPDNLPCINHKDENSLNNASSNLEWCTYEYNNTYGTRIQRASEAMINHPKMSKKVLQFTKSGEFIKEYPSLNEAQRQTGVLSGNISQCCLGRIKSSGGYIWKYA